MVPGTGAEETEKKADTNSEDDWDSEIELEEVDEDDVNDYQRTKEENNLKDCNDNLVTKVGSPVRGTKSIEESDEEVVIEEVKDEHEGKPGRKKCMFCHNQYPIEKFIKHIQQVHGKDPETLKVTCRYCKERVLSIRLHRKVCSEATKQCPHCNMKLCSKDDLNRHTNSCHTVKIPTFNCHLCTSVFYYDKDLKRHLITHDSSNYRKCRFCSKKFTNLKILHHEQRCKESRKEKSEKERRRQELKNMKEKKRQEINITNVKKRQEMRTRKECRHCSKKLIIGKFLNHEEKCPQSKLLKRIRSREMMKEKYRNQASCRICSKPIKWCYYTKHLKEAHNTKVERVRCSYCRKTFHPDLGFKDHEDMCKKRQEGERRSEGEDSGKGEKAEEEGEQESRCDYCDKEIMGEEKMEEHKVRCWEDMYGRRGVDG